MEDKSNINNKESDNHIEGSDDTIITNSDLKIQRIRILMMRKATQKKYNNQEESRKEKKNSRH